MDSLREIAASTITTTYQNLGTALTRDCFVSVISNNTNGDMYVTIDGTNNQMKFAATTARAYDAKTNDMYFKAGTQFQIKFANANGSTAPVAPTGWFGLELTYV